jgi:hypothetical protein
MKKKYESDFTKKTIGNKIVKISKMKAGAGAVNDYEFNDPNVKQFFLEMCRYIQIQNKTEANFKVMYRKMDTLGLILFGVNLEIIGVFKYLPYIYYLYKDTVKFKRVSDNMGRIVFTDITFEELSKQKFREESYTSLLLNFLSYPRKHNFNSNSRNDEFNKLLSKLNEKIISTQNLPQMQQYPQTQNLPQMQQYPQTQSSPQKKTQIKIKFLTNELNKIIIPQNKLFQNIGVNPTENQKIKLQELLNKQQKLKEQIQQELSNLQNNPITQNIQRQLKNMQQQQLTNKLQRLNNKQKQIQELFNKQTFNITKQNLTNRYSFYRCEVPSLEVKIGTDGNIFFGYDKYLFVKSQDGSYKLYYKYSYHNGKFFKLIKKKDGTFVEEEIDINLIKTYDILRLFFAIKENPQKDLQQKLQIRIDIAKKNISETGESFFKLEHSNFEKEQANLNQKRITDSKYKNFGKVKERRVTQKTYIFFGEKIVNNNNLNSKNLLYVCFREDNKVFYYEKQNLKEKKDLNDFPYINPLEDLISFILLRRLITGDNTFADIIYREADARIKFLKTNKFAEKMLLKESPTNFYYGFGNRLYKQKNEKQTSLLPISNSGIPT